jgi:hypothetical protein
LFLSFLSLYSNGLGRKMLWKEVGGSIWSIHCHKSTLRYVNTITNNLLWWSCATYNTTINMDEWRYGNGRQGWWWMTTMADDDDTRDWAADCNGEGQERALRDGGDSRVVMMAAAAEDGSGG